MAIDAAVCHVVCKVQSMEEEEGHFLVHAHMHEAFVRRSYWNGKQFCGRDPMVPPLLTFLGSQRFAYIVPEPPSVGTSPMASATAHAVTAADDVVSAAVSDED